MENHKRPLTIARMARVLHRCMLAGGGRSVRNPAARMVIITATQAQAYRACSKCFVKHGATGPVSACPHCTPSVVQ